MIRILSISFFSFFIFFQSAIQQAHAAQATLLYDIDGDNKVTALVDGLLLLRYSFDFRGTTLTEGAVSNESTRTTAQIEAYINDNLSKFDLDGNNQVKPLTDGLLLVRALFGFTGDTLTNGVLGDGATRTTADQIITYLESSGPTDVIVDTDNATRCTSYGFATYSFHGTKTGTGTVSIIATASCPDTRGYGSVSGPLTYTLTNLAYTGIASDVSATMTVVAFGTSRVSQVIIRNGIVTL